MATWRQIGDDNRAAAAGLVGDHYRSCVSRAYYAAYARITHELDRLPGVTFPAGREGPSHPGTRPDGSVGAGGIRRMIEEQLRGLDEADRLELSEALRELYTLRLHADYRPSEDVGETEARDAVTLVVAVNVLCNRIAADV